MMPLTLTEADASKVLDRAATLLEQGWTKAAYGRTAEGFAVSALDPRAVRWCLVGAVTRAMADLFPETLTPLPDELSVLRTFTPEGYRLYCAMRERLPQRPDPENWNDAHGAAEGVIEAVRAAALAAADAAHVPSPSPYSRTCHDSFLGAKSMRGGR